MDSSMINKVTGKESVISKLGYWPEFCDAKFLEWGFSHLSDFETSISMLLHYIDTDKGLDLNVRIVLFGISHMGLHDIAIENIVDCIELTESDVGDVEFKIESAAGLYGVCTCEAVNIELLSIKSL